MLLFVIVVCDGGPLLPPSFKTYTQECTEGRKCETHESRTPRRPSSIVSVLFFSSLVVYVFFFIIWGCGKNVPAYWNGPKTLFISINNSAAGQKSSWTTVHLEQQVEMNEKNCDCLGNQQKREAWRNRNLLRVSAPKSPPRMKAGTNISFIQAITIMNKPLLLSRKSKQRR